MQDKGSINFSYTQDEGKKQDKLDTLLAKKKKLYQISALFPFQLAPDQLIIDTQKVTIIYNQFFGTTSAETILLDQIEDLDIDLGFLFGSLKILSLSHERQWMKITHLSRNEAVRAKRIIEGLLIAKKEGIDFDEAEDSLLVNKLEKLGSSL